MAQEKIEERQPGKPEKAQTQPRGDAQPETVAPQNGSPAGETAPAQPAKKTGAKRRRGRKATHKPAADAPAKQPEAAPQQETPVEAQAPHDDAQPEAAAPQNSSPAGKTAPAQPAKKTGAKRRRGSKATHKPAADAPAKQPEVAPEQETPVEAQAPHDDAQPETAAPQNEAAQPAEEMPTEQPDAMQTQEAPMQQPDNSAAPEAEQPEGDDTPAVQPPTEEAPTQQPDAAQQEERLADMTRTVQLSIQQILEAADQSAADEAQPEEGEPYTELPEEAEQDPEEELATLGQRAAEAVADGARGLLKWLLLVVFFVLVIAGAGIAWLYRGATPDLIPTIESTFEGEPLQVTSYQWHVPVVSNLFKRTYAKTVSAEPVAIAQKVETLHPRISYLPSEYQSTLVIQDANLQTLFEGSLADYAVYSLPGNGEYTARLELSNERNVYAGSAEVSGTQTSWFSFTVRIKPTIQLSATRALQGSVVAVRVGRAGVEETPRLDCTLQNQGFQEASTGWVCYLPIPVDAPTGETTVTVHAGDTVETLTLRVEPREFAYVDYGGQRQLSSPYVDLRAPGVKLSNALHAEPTEIRWADDGFALPFGEDFELKMAFATREYVGRTKSERTSGTGNGRVATMATVRTRSGEAVTAPAAGTVLLAADVGGDAGTTLVLDHGGGVMSVLCNLSECTVNRGDTVKQGDEVAVSKKTTLCGVCVGGEPVDALEIWGGKSNATRSY